MAQSKSTMNIAILAGGTGGHIFPALAVARALQQKGHQVSWMGAEKGMETRIVPKEKILFDEIRIQNLRGKGFWRYCGLPLRLCVAIFEARAILKKRRIDLVIGFGGFVAGPGGIAAISLGIPLLIHEQNAIGGLTNRYLAKVATAVLVGFPAALPFVSRRIVTGNPVREDLIPLRSKPYAVHQPLNILVIGGSLGAKIFNEIMPEVYRSLPLTDCPALLQQTGAAMYETTKKQFDNLNVTVTAFIDNMNHAYATADLVICRAGALTVAELALIGRPAVFVPLPHAVDNHQTLNARTAVDAGAAILIPQAECTAKKMTQVLNMFIQNPALLSTMAENMHSLGQADATEKVIAACEAVFKHRQKKSR